jgi:hypothetical protein
VKYAAKLPVKFKNLSVGDTIATLGVSIDRDRVNIDFCEEAFCGKRDLVRILIGPGADPDQGILWDDVQFDVEAHADIKKYSVTPKLISIGLAFLIDSIDIEDLAHFAKKEGTLFIVKVLGDAKDAKGPDDDGDETEVDDDEEE